MTGFRIPAAACAALLALAGPAGADGLSIGRAQQPVQVPEYDRPFKEGWRVCNLSEADRVNVAWRVREGERWVTRGWMVIDRGDCKTLQSRLSNRTAYYYARGRKPDGGQAVWAARERMRCVNQSRRFEVADRDCPDGFEQVGFREVKMTAAGHTTRLGR